MSTEDASTQGDAESDEPAAVDEWIKLHADMKTRQEAVGGEAFLKKLNGESAKTVRGELRDWIYAFLLRAAETAALAAGDVDDLVEEIGEMREEMERLANLTRAIASTNFFALVQRLVVLVQQRVQDPETLQAAQIVAALFSPAQLPAQTALAETAPATGP